MTQPHSDPAAPADNWQARVDAVWADPSASELEVVERIEALTAELPDDDPRGPFQLGGAHDSAGLEARAAELYERAIELGLDGQSRAELDIQYASTLRNLGRTAEALAVLEASAGHPSLGAAPDAFYALALHSAGRSAEAVAVLIEALVPSLPKYQRSLAGYAAEARAGAARPQPGSARE
ncbi:tetratricopeptide repeat protein [Leucobacter albus]|uniref:Tetratricopeptide repeat protein n=1 Tax=Leucobacter albus TaxID=272210 RepID=A0ABW3TRZ5_9MICO